MKIITVLILIISLSGCGVDKKEKRELTDNSWKNEILELSNCGLEGLTCCNDKEDLCGYELTCCTNPSDESENICAKECSCGSDDKFCCAENKCEEGLACDSGSCVKCGLNGNPCCGDGQGCAGEDLFTTEKLQCVEGICKSCGYHGKSICSGELRCIPNHFISNNTCLGCGEFNQPCCQSEFGDKCNTNKNLKCDLGFCIKK